MRIHDRAMRSDMHEVVIERPRWGHALRYPRARMRRRNGGEDGPSREAMGRAYREKQLSDNLAPLRRYLQSNVGRPWSKVRSEISAHLRVTSAVQKHIFEHLAHYVCERTFERSGEVWGADHYGRPQRFGARFYVHPRTQLLEMAPRAPRKLASRLRIHNPDVREVCGRFLRRIGGEWFEVELASFPASAEERVWDAFARKLVWRWLWSGTADDAHSQAQWRRGLYARSLRLLSKRERCQLLS